jgi:hypothetical protein
VVENNHFLQLSGLMLSDKTDGKRLGSRPMKNPSSRKKTGSVIIE